MSISLKEIELKKHLSELVELCQQADVNFNISNLSSQKQYSF